MEATISISSSYGFDHNWSLDVTFDDGKKKSFYLGQDVKFCSRVLGMQPVDIQEETGIYDLRPEENKQKMANFIINALELDDKILKTLQIWELCCQ